jgi:aminopeptidase N
MHHFFLNRARRLTYCAAFLSILLELSLFSCHPPRKILAKSETIDTITVSANNNPESIYRATSPRVWEIVHTGLTLRFDFAKREAEGEALLSLMPYTRAIDTVTLDAKSMEIKSVGVKDFNGNAVTPLAYKYNGLQLKIDVSKLQFGNLIMRRQQTIRIEYIAKPYATPIGGSAAITEDRGLYFINTDKAIPGKPVQIWTQGETESNSHWMPTIDKPNQRSTFTIALIVPDSMQTLSNGQLVNVARMEDGLRKDTWQMPQPIQMYAAMFAIGRFDVAKDEWKDAQGMPHEVSFYTEPAYAPYAREMFKNTPEMMTCFSKVTGVSYPWIKYSQVVVRDYVSGAMENTGASLFGEFANKNARQLLDESNEDVVSHELFHQWFGDYVTAESWSNLTLNESFATFGEQIWRRYKYGQASTDELAYNDLQRYLGSTQFTDPPLVRYYYRDREVMFDRISYQKGAATLRYIHSLTGDTLFSRAMELYLRRNALESAEAAHWRQALETATGKDWMPFFNQWYYRGGHPVLTVRYAFDAAHKKMNVTVRQRTSPDSSFLYDLQLKTAIIYDKQHQRIEDWRINERTQQFSYDADASGKFPVIIPDVTHVLPGIIRDDKAIEAWRDQLELASDYISKVQAIEAAFAYETRSLSPTILKRALEDTLSGIRLYAMRRLSAADRPAWREALLQQVKYMLQTDANNKVRAAALTTLGSWKERSEIPTMIASVSDSSYLVSGAALQALTIVNSDTAYVLANDVLRHEPKGALQQAAWNAIVTKGNPADMERFQDIARHVYGTEKVALAGNLQAYATNVKDDALFERSLVLLTKMAKDEAIRSYRLAIGSNVYELRNAYRKKPSSTRKQLAEQYATEVMRNEGDADNLRRYRGYGQ